MKPSKHSNEIALKSKTAGATDNHAGGEAFPGHECDAFDERDLIWVALTHTTVTTILTV